MKAKASKRSGQAPAGRSPQQAVVRPRCVEVATARVFVAGNRRYLTKRAAYIGAALQRIKRACYCEGDPVDLTGEEQFHPCKYHRDYRHTGELVKRLARMLQRADAA